MITVAETVFENDFSERLRGECDKTYVMKGSFAEKALETYHLILAPSFRCNLACSHCYLSNHDALTLPKKRVLDLVDEWSEIVIEERGPFRGILHLKGGEPLILPYLTDILDRLEDLKTLRFMMTTNGVVGSQEIVERLRRLSTALDGNVQIIVSIDGSNDAVNAQLRGSGNFEKAEAFVRMLRDADITVYLNNVLHKGNLSDVESFVELAIDLDVQQVNFLSFNPKGYGEQMASLAPNPAEVFRCIDTVWKRGGRRVQTLLAGSLSHILRAESCGDCTSPECVGAYRGLFYIVPDGTAYSCPNLSFSGLEGGNILHSNLKAIHDAMSTTVYEHVATPDGTSQDRYLCKGIKRLSLQDGSFRSSNNLGIQVMEDIPGHREMVSYCFSRNF